MITPAPGTLTTRLDRPDLDTIAACQYMLQYNGVWHKAVELVEGMLGAGCPTCIHNPPPGHRCPQEDLGLSPTWRTRCHGVGCPKRKVETTTEEVRP